MTVIHLFIICCLALELGLVNGSKQPIRVKDFRTVSTVLDMSGSAVPRDFRFEERDRSCTKKTRTVSQRFWCRFFNFFVEHSANSDRVVR